MKIRIDFVTNSSSSNFTVEVKIKTSYKSVWISEDPFSHESCDSGGDATFNGDLREINDHLSSVKELATWLANSIEPDPMYSSGFKKKQNKFITEACKNIKNVKDIETITVEREYSAWGEFADLVADNNYKLCEYAEKYLNSTGIEKKRAEAEMITYIHTAENARGENFGENSVISRFEWNGDSVEELSKRLCNRYCSDSVNGVERKELNLKTGEYFDVSDFELE